MATDLENLIAIRSNLLAALRTESANPKPSYTVGNQSVDWNGYRAALLQQIEQINAQMAGVEPFEVEVQGVPG